MSEQTWATYFAGTVEMWMCSLTTNRYAAFIHKIDEGYLWSVFRTGGAPWVEVSPYPRPLVDTLEDAQRDVLAWFDEDALDEAHRAWIQRAARNDGAGGA